MRAELLGRGLRPGALEALVSGIVIIRCAGSMADEWKRSVVKGTETSRIQETDRRQRVVGERLASRRKAGFCSTRYGHVIIAAEFEFWDLG